MPKQETLTIDSLINLAEKKEASFSNQSHLSTEEQDALRKCADIVKLELSTLSRNTSKRRAKGILTALWARRPALYVLIALSAHPTKLGTLKSSEYLRLLLDWWDKTVHPAGLDNVLELHQDILPLSPTGKIDLSVV